MLSIHQSDNIVYGASLQQYLCNELRDVLGGEHRFNDDTPRSIPFWGELIA